MQISQNYFKFVKKPAVLFIAIFVWFVVSYCASQLLVSVIMSCLKMVGVPVLSINSYILNAITSFFWYSLALLIMISVPRRIAAKATSLKDMGLGRYLSWTDILMTPVGFIVYMIIAAILMMLAKNFIPGFDPDQAQDVGFSGISQRYEYIMAFMTLVVIAPIAEELIFRGYLYGRLRKFAPIWLSTLVVSIAFGFLHGAWNLAFDTFALSVVLCLMREFTGSIGTSILIHMTKNGIAYFFLFIYPLISATIK